MFTTAHWYVWGLSRGPEHALRSTLKQCNTNITFFTSEMFFPLQFEGIIFPLCSIAQAVSRLVLCFCCHMKRVEITIIATMWLQKWKTKVLPFSWKHQLQDRWIFFPKCSHQVAVKSFFSFHLCAFCWVSKPVLPVDGWSQENCSVHTLAKLTPARKRRGLKSCLSEKSADPAALSS